MEIFLIIALVICLFRVYVVILLLLPSQYYYSKFKKGHNCFTNKQDAVKYGIEYLLTDIKYANQNIQTELENFNNRLNRYTTTIKNSQEALEKL